MHNYIYISKKLIKLGCDWEGRRGIFYSILALPDSFSRLTLWG